MLEQVAELSSEFNETYTLDQANTLIVEIETANRNHEIANINREIDDLDAEIDELTALIEDGQAIVREPSPGYLFENVIDRREILDDLKQQRDELNDRLDEVKSTRTPHDAAVDDSEIDALENNADDIRESLGDGLDALRDELFDQDSDKVGGIPNNGGIVGPTNSDLSENESDANSRLLNPEEQAALNNALDESFRILPLMEPQ